MPAAPAKELFFGSDPNSKEKRMSKGKQLFVNLPVKDLDRTKQFFAKVGFEFNPRFTDQNAACMIIGEDCFVMLLKEEFFKPFTNKPIADATKGTEAILAVSVGSRGKVDEMVGKALMAGGKPANEKQDQGFMYGWSFQDPDGHQWEVFHMDLGALPKA
jgi:uncharacterized protein